MTISGSQGSSGNHPLTSDTAFARMQKHLERGETKGVEEGASLLFTLDLPELPSIKEEALERFAPEAESYLRFGANFLTGGIITGGDGALQQDGMMPRAGYKMLKWMISSMESAFQGRSECPEKQVIDAYSKYAGQIADYLEDIEEAREWKKSGRERDLQGLAMQYSEKIRALQEGESQCFYSGYKNIGGGSGHALVTQVRRREDRTFDIKLYTSTAYQLAESVMDGDKVRQVPVVSYLGIPEVVLLRNHDGKIRPTFIQSLIEVDVLGSWDTSRIVGEENVQQCFDPFLSYYDESKSIAGLITGQRAGTCVSSSAKVLLRGICPDIGLYKQLIFHMSLRLLVALFRDFQKEMLSARDDKGEICRRFLEEAAKNMLRKVAKLEGGLHEQGVLADETLVKTTEATCKEILQQVDAARAKIAAAEQSEHVKTDLALLDVDGQVKEREKASIDTYRGANAPAVLSSNLPQLYSRGAPPAKGALIGALKQAGRVCYGPMHLEAARLEIHSLVDSLPLPDAELELDAYWKQFNARELRHVIRELTSLAKHYVYDKEMQNSDYPTRRFATVASLEVLVHALAIRVEDKRPISLPQDAQLKNYKINNSLMTLINVDGMIYRDRFEHERLEACNAYFKRFNHRIHSKDILFETEETADVVKKTVWDIPGNGVYFHALLAADEQLKKAVKDEIESRHDIATISQKEIDADYNQQQKAYQRWEKAYEAWRKSYLAEYRDPPQQPPNPKKLVNLPLTTQQTLVLQETGRPLKHNMLVKCGYDYVEDLRHMIYLTEGTLLADRSEPLPELVVISTRADRYKYDATAHLDRMFSPDQSSRNEQVLRYFESGLSAVKYRSFQSDYRVIRRGPGEMKSIAEGRTLADRNQSSLEGKFLRTLADWKLSLHQMMYEAKNAFARFKEREMQTFFMLLFFRSPRISSHNFEHLGAGKLLLTDSALRESAHTFITEGTNFFLNQQYDVSGARFFFEFAYTIQKYLVDGGQRDEAAPFSQISSINHWLSEHQITSKNRSVLHLYRILAYSQQPQERLGGEELSEIYESWVSYNLYPEEHANRSPQAYEAAKLYIIALTSTLQSKEIDYQQFVSVIFKKLDIDDSSVSGTWQISPTGLPLLQKGSVAKNDYFKLDLALGKIYNPLGTYENIPAEPRWESSEQFRRLMHGKCRFTYYALGGGNIGFTHPTMGAIRLAPLGGDGHYYAIMRKFEGQHGWFQYFDQQSLRQGQTKVLPDILMHDHAFWSPLEDQGVKGIFTHLKDHNKHCWWGKDGEIRTYPSEGACAQCVYHFPKHEGYQGIFTFEHHANMLCLKADKESAIDRVIFPRYTAQGGGDPLTFVADPKVPGRLLWKENRGYYLGKQRPAYLDKIPNCLYLRSVDGAGTSRILVPFQKLLSSKNPSTKAVLEIHNTKPLIPIAKERKPVEQEGAFQYLVYNYDKEGNLTAPTLEGWLFLAYLHLGQKDYAKASALLRKIKPTDKLSEMSLKILKMIHVLELGENHPGAVILRLKAALILMQVQDEAAVERVKAYYGESPEQLALLWSTLVYATQYLNNINNLSIELRLTSAEEYQVLTNLIQEVHSKEHLLREELKVEASSIVTALQHAGRRQAFLADRSQLQQQQKVHTGTRQYEIQHKISILNSVSYRLPDRPVDESHGRFAYENKQEARRAGKRYERTRECAKQEYKRDLEWYTRRLEAATSWLSDGEVSTRYTHVDDTRPFFQNGCQLLETLRIVKHGTVDEQSELKYRLALWKTNVKSAQERSSRDLDVMLCMLSYPQACQRIWEIDPKTASLEEKRTFLKSIEQMYSRSNFCYQSWFDTLYPSLMGVNRSGTAPGKLEQIEADKKGRFPHQQRSAFDCKWPTLKDMGDKKELVSVDVKSHNHPRWEQLNDWHALLTVSKRQHGAPSTLKCDITAVKLSSEEESFTKSLEQEFRELEKDFKEGQAQNASRQEMALSLENAQKLQQEAKACLQKVNNDLATRRSELMQLAHQHAEGDIAHGVLTAGGVKRQMSFGDCVTSLLSLDHRQYRLHNSSLTQADVESMANLTLEVEEAKSYQAQLKRIIESTEKIAALTDPKDITRIYECQKLADELSATYHFVGLDDDVKVALRVFAGETGMIPHKKQTDLIKKMLKVSDEDPKRFKDIVIQLIMGGGKTSVLATIILYLSARREGRTALFLVPAALFDTVCSNFSASLLKAFHKQTYSIDVERSELTDYKLAYIQERLEKAEAEGAPIVMKATTLACFELECIATAREAEKVMERKNREEAKLLPCMEGGAGALLLGKISGLDERFATLTSRLQLLTKIVGGMRKHGDALLDEEDLLLAANSEVIFPFGVKEHLHPSENALLAKIFSYLTSESITAQAHVGEAAPTLASVVRLHENQQTNMSEAYFKERVAPAVVEHLVKDFAPLRDAIGDFEGPCKRYILGQIPSFIQAFADNPHLHFKETTLEQYDTNWARYGSFAILEKDVAFLRHLASVYQTERESDDQISGLIPVAKYYIQDLLPKTLQKTGRRDYGPPSDGRSENVMVPYDAVETPATTEFGNHREQACYQYQYAAAFKVSTAQILEIAEDMKKSAEFYMDRDKEEFKKTAEYAQFLETFNVPLDRIHDHGMLEKAQAYVSANMQQKLTLAFEHVAREVTFHSENLRSDAMNLLSQLASKQAMSGTTWNADGLAESLAKQHESDLGTEGKILDKLLRTARKDKIHEQPFETIEALIGGILDSHKSPKQVRGIIEAGGQFVKFGSNANVARDLAAALEKRKATGKVDASLEGVLFFHTDPGQSKADTLYVWKLGATAPERIGGSSFEMLKAKGLEPKNYFVLYDERHTTGTDILQLPDAINCMTFDKQMLKRTFCQASMRLRQLLFTQDVEFLVTPEVRQTLVNGGKTLEDLILSTAKEQAIEKAKAMVRYFCQQIDNIFRSAVIDVLLKKIENDEAIQEVLSFTKECRSFLFTEIKDIPFAMFGRLTQQVDTKKMLLIYLNKQHESFRQAMASHPDLFQDVAKEVASKTTYIKETKALPETSPDNTVVTGTEQEVAVQQQVQARVHKEVEQEIELEQELQLELKQYAIRGYEEIYPEHEMTRPEFDTLLNSLKANKLRPLSAQLSAYEYGPRNGAIRKHYERCFTQPIYGTHAYFRTLSYREVIPVFSEFQRPPKQVLAMRIKVGEVWEMRWLLLSEREADGVREHLGALHSTDPKSVEDVWLIHPNGTAIVQGEQQELFPLGEDSDYPTLAAGLLEINAFGGHATYLSRQSDALENWLAEGEGEDESSEIAELKIRFLKMQVEKDKLERRILRHCRAIYERNDSETYTPSVWVYQKRLDRENNRQGTEQSDNPDALPISRIKRLHVASVPKLSTPKLIKKLQHFHGPHITPEQVPHLEKAQIPYLKDPKQIQDKDGVCILRREQVHRLEIHQRHFIPYLKPEFYSALTKDWQVKAVPPKHVMQINTQQWHLLSREQVKALPVEQIENLDHLKHPEKYGWVNGQFIDRIPEKFLHHITAEQVKEITDPSLITRLEEIAQRSETPIHAGRWTSWLAPAQVSAIHFEKQAQFLQAPEQIQAVPSKGVPYLTTEQVPHIQASQAAHLQGKKQISCCPNRLIAYIAPAQVQHVIDAQIPYLRGTEQLAQLRNDQVQYLNAQEGGELDNQIPSLPDSLLPHMTRQQVVGVSMEQVLKLSPAQIRGLSPKQIQSMDSAELINLLSEQQIHDHLQQGQVRFLSTEQHIQALRDELVPAIATPEHIQWIKAEQVPALQGEGQIQNIKDTHIEHLVAQQITWVSPDQVSSLNSAQIPYLTKPEQIQVVKHAYVEYLIDTQVGMIRPVQAKYLKPHQIQYLKTAEQIQAIHDDDVQELVGQQLSKISPGQVPYLIRSQVQHLTQADVIQELKGAFVTFLTPKQLLHIHVNEVPHITDRQVPHITGRERINNIQTSQVKCLAGPQIKFLDANRVAHIETHQAEHLRTEAQIKDCPMESIHNIHESMVQHITDAQLTFLLSKEGGIQGLAKKFIACLNREQVKLISDAQIQLINNREEVKYLEASQFRHLSQAGIQALTDEQVKELVADHSLQNRLQDLSSAQLPLVTDPQLYDSMTSSQFEGVDYNKLKVKPPHPLFGRITTKNVRTLDASRVHLIAKDQLQYLKSREQIRAVSFGRVEYLTKEQLRERSWGQFMVYALGVMTLGLIGSLLALVAYLTIIPLGMLASCGQSGMRQTLAVIDTAPRKLYRFLSPLTDPEAAEIKVE